MSNINVTIDNPYGDVTIPRAKIRSAGDVSTVITNPMALNSDAGNGAFNSTPPPYVVKEAGGGEEEEVRSRGCCYRCRRKK